MFVNRGLTRGKKSMFQVKVNSPLCSTSDYLTFFDRIHSQSGKKEEKPSWTGDLSWVHPASTQCQLG